MGLIIVYKLSIYCLGPESAADDEFDVDDFIRRMTIATGLNVQEVYSHPNDKKREGRRFSIRPVTKRFVCFVCLF